MEAPTSLNALGLMTCHAAGPHGVTVWNGTTPMWCGNCQADVASEVSENNRRVYCATCGTELFRSDPAAVNAQTPVHAQTKDARKLLQRWSSTAVLDPYGPAMSAKTGNVPASGDSSPRDVVPPEDSKTLRSAHDSHHGQVIPEDKPMSSSTSLTGQAAHNVQLPWKEAPETNPSRIRPHSDEPSVTEPPEPQQVPPRVHVTHRAAPAQPHFDVQAAISETQDNQKRRPNWLALFGQFLAYGGVLALTLGTSLVLWGYFGGPANYAPTGWLITTAGQMLLFLGVVTLVSGGMEQTTEEVARRIDRLGDKILRIEIAARGHQLGGPNLPPQSFAPNAPAAPRTADSERSTPVG